MKEKLLVFLMANGFQGGTLSMLNDTNLKRLAADYGYKF